jgi:hypothetical protein
LSLLLASGIVGAPAQSASPEAAAQRLKSVGVYAFGKIGFVGMTSPGELDYRAILSATHEQALNLFEDVFAHGNRQGRSYALAGIHKLDPERFKELYEEVATSDEMVFTQGGCVISRSKLKDIAKGIRARDDWASKVSSGRTVEQD